MTTHELSSKWQEFAIDLVDAKRKHILEQPYQERIEAAFRALGWSKAKGEICPKERINVGANNQIEPDITLKISDKPVFVIEIKQPTNNLTTRQIEQLLSYMRQRKVVFGLYIGDEICLFYDNGDDLPTSVLQIDIDTEAENGGMFIDFFDRNLFSTERIKSYCKERYNEIYTNNTLNDFTANLDENSDKTIKSILQEYFVTIKNCENGVICDILNTYNFQASKKGKTETQSPDEANNKVGTSYVLQQQDKNSKKKRDTTKYSIDGGSNYFGKGRFVREIVATYLTAHPNTEFEQLKRIFPRELHGSFEVVQSWDTIQNSNLGKRYIMDDDKVLTTKDGVRFVVCRDWGKTNIVRILKLLYKWDWTVLVDKG